MPVPAARSARNGSSPKTPLALGCLALLAAACADARGRDNEAPEVRSQAIKAIDFDAIYVVNGDDATVSVINAETSQVAGTIRLFGVAYPHHVYVSPDRAVLGIAVPGFDMSEGHLGHEIHSARPGVVVLLDAVTGERLNAVRTDASNHNVAFPPNLGGEVWTSQATSPGTTLVLDRVTLEVKDVISVGDSPSETTFSADGRFAFVANTGSASISVIDTTQRRVVKQIPVGSGPVGAWQGPNGVAYVDNEGDHTITVIDTVRLEALRTFPLPFRPGLVAVSATAPGEVWITDPGDARVEVRSPTGEVLRTAKTGRGAHAIVFSPDGQRAYVTNLLEDNVHVFDTRTLELHAIIPVGARPNGLAWRSK